MGNSFHLHNPFAPNGHVHDDPFRRQHPYPLRIKGSILFRILPQVIFATAVATIVTCVSALTDANLGIDNVLISVLGFIVGLCLSFRTSAAYERWSEGRKQWTAIQTLTRTLTRLIWVCVEEETTTDILEKKSAINLLLAFAVATKHHLREERGTDYEDLRDLVPHLHTYGSSRAPTMIPVQSPSASATGSALSSTVEGLDRRPTWVPQKRILGLSGTHRHGNLPLEISAHLTSYVQSCVKRQKFDAVTYGQCMTALSALSEAKATCERILWTPIPVAYNIVISQIVWIFVLVMPFQLYSKLHWITIPAVFVASYVMLGLAAIGLEIENPFGYDVNDLDLDSYCNAIKLEIAVLTSVPPPRIDEWMYDNPLARPLWPQHKGDFRECEKMGEQEVRQALRLGGQKAVRDDCVRRGSTGEHEHSREGTEGTGSSTRTRVVDVESAGGKEDSQVSVEDVA
ncbi:UPF0187-domain-containing protein [Saitoella complicata NRRL Y-17804]|nr:UPF0187-domain-containing protein [Saitoella complicata NRRL Y-17804]ODQ52351.1 UPF0187-domain-containing protein [Saitoella complicata NRRL Y-17804]